MGIDPARFPLTRRERPFRPTRILTIGRLVEKKGIEYGLRAVARLPGETIPIRYDVIGDGPLRPRLEKMACELGIAARVGVHGSMVQRDVIRAMQHSDILLAPTVTDATGQHTGLP